VISDYWVNFVKTGSPNGKGLPEWPAADPDRQMLMETGDDLHARPALSPEKRKLLEEFVRQGGTVGMF
jgi:para-nitrobenzyl esterase